MRQGRIEQRAGEQEDEQAGAGERSGRARVQPGGQVAQEHRQPGQAGDGAGGGAQQASHPRLRQQQLAGAVQEEELGQPVRGHVSGEGGREAGRGGQAGH